MKIGDIVSLRSGSPNMTIVNIGGGKNEEHSDDEAECGYFHQNQYFTIWIKFEALIKKG